MKNLYKAMMFRLSRNLIFIGGCILAAIATFAFTSNIIGMTGRFGNMLPERRMYFISIAMMGFFTIFIPIFTNEEYRDGVIRSKVIAGFTQREVYLVHLLGHISAMAIMMLCYFVAGILGGARIGTDYILSNVILFFALCGYISFMVLISMRIRRMVLVAVAAFLVLNISYNSVMIGNALLAFILKGTAFIIGRVIYNIFVFGQWFTHTGFADDMTSPGFLVQIVISVVVLLLSALLGIAGINKRDLK